MADRAFEGGGRISVLLAGDAALRRLNRTFRSKDRPTDVLAFPPPPSSRGRGRGRSSAFLGDVAVSVDACERQARALGIGAGSRLLHLLAHGVLHLSGLDHESPADFERMETRTRELCEAAQAPCGLPVDNPDRPGVAAPSASPRTRQAVRPRGRRAG